MLNKTLLFAALLALPSGLAAQSNDNTGSPAWHSSQKWALTKLAADPDWNYLDGLYWRRVAGDGTGSRPLASDKITIHYAGTLVDGTVFDSSYEQGFPATYTLDRLIKAWQLAIPQMGVGDTIEIVTPASLAYGPNRRGPIPGGATLLFKVELIAIEGR